MLLIRMRGVIWSDLMIYIIYIIYIILGYISQHKVEDEARALNPAADELNILCVCVCVYICT